MSPSTLSGMLHGERLVTCPKGSGGSKICSSEVVERMMKAESSLLDDRERMPKPLQPPSDRPRMRQTWYWRQVGQDQKHLYRGLTCRCVGAVPQVRCRLYYQSALGLDLQMMRPGPESYQTEARLSRMVNATGQSQLCRSAADGFRASLANTSATNRFFMMIALQARSKLEGPSNEHPLKNEDQAFCSLLLQRDRFSRLQYFRDRELGRFKRFDILPAESLGALLGSALTVKSRVGFQPSGAHCN